MCHRLYAGQRIGRYFKQTHPPFCLSLAVIAYLVEFHYDQPLLIHHHQDILSVSSIVCNVVSRNNGMTPYDCCGMINPKPSFQAESIRQFQLSQTNESPSNHNTPISLPTDRPINPPPQGLQHKSNHPTHPHPSTHLKKKSTSRNPNGSRRRRLPARAPLRSLPTQQHHPPTLDPRNRALSARNTLDSGADKHIAGRDWEYMSACSGYAWEL